WGYQASSGWTPNTAMTSRGWLWSCSRSGVVIANLNSAGANSVPPPVSVEAMSVDGKRVEIGSAIQVKAHPDEIEFELGAMSFRLPEQVRLEYRIDKVDTGWVTAGKDRIARYTRLAAGNHILRVRATNEDGVLSEREAMLAFEVVPAFVETTAFRVAVIAITAVIMFLAARLLVLRKLRKATAALREQVAVNGERVRIARDMHDQLGASLTQISLITDLMASEGMEDKRIGQLARTARQASTALDEIVWAVNPRHDHLGSVLEYLGQQAVNLLEPAGLRCRLDIPQAAPDRHLPAEFRHQLFLIVREAINNAIKHASAKEVSLSAEVTESSLRLVIADDGRGGASQSGGEGLHNMRSRAETLGGDCQIHSAAGKGTTVELKVPWPNRPRSS
ncbi:MAG TPA: ATP-binding protein, partial [Candidatus Saccharimonadia bacterium]|nr:ATP-binding protein [Candidatus Saccharimonadia bacterium]